MAHSIAPPAAARAATPISKYEKPSPHVPPQTLRPACHPKSNESISYQYLVAHLPRRAVTRTLGLAVAGAVLGLNGGEQSANAARRPPPPPPEDKKDPNVSGVQAKVQASKKRKEAMKKAMAELREKGKPVDGGPPSDSNQPPSDSNQ